MDVEINEQLTEALPAEARGSVHLRERWLLPVALLYLLLALAMTWPVVANLGKIAGEGVDIYSHLWTFHWIRDALLSGQNPYFTDRIFYPSGVSLANHNIAWLHILLWIPLQALFDGIPAYNILMLGIIAINGIAMYLLAQELLQSRSTAFVSGLIFAFWPYVITQNEHPNLMFVTWVPLSILFLRRTLARPRRRDLLLAALFMALIGWARLQLMVIAAFPIGLFVLALLWSQDWTTRKRSLGQLVLIGAITTVLILPIMLPVAAYQYTRANPEDLYFDQHDEKQTDLLAYISPTQQHPLWESTLEPIYGRFYQNFDPQNQQRTPYLGYTVILLALVGAGAAAPRSRIWIIIAVTLIVLALGPTLRINGQHFPQIPMPYRLVEENPFMRLLRTPDRLNVLLGLPVGLLAGFGLDALGQWVKRPSHHTLLVGLAAFLVLVEYATFPFPQSPVDVPDWLAARQNDPGDYAIVQLPDHLFKYNKYYMYYQTVHGKLLVNGKVARVPREALAFWETVPLLEQMGPLMDIPANLPDVSYQLSLLNKAGVRYIVIDKTIADSGHLVAWRDWFTIDPEHEDEELLVYKTAPQASVDFDFVQMLTTTVGLIRQNTGPTTAVPGGTLKAMLRLGSTAPPGQTLDACLQLVSAADGIVHQGCRPITPEWDTAVWPANAVVREGYILPIDSTIPPGDYTLHLQLADTAGKPQGESVSLGPVAVAPYQPTATANITWQNKISLPDYDLEQTTEALNLTFYWRALRDIENQYKFFVHVIDPTTGDIVSQVDAAPRNWTYPTFAWEPGERVHDNVTLSLSELPPGRYDVKVGWYNQATGKRLAATTPDNDQTQTSVSLTSITLP